MGDPIFLPPPDDSVPVLNIGRAYSAQDAANILGITQYVLNERGHPPQSRSKPRPHGDGPRI